MGGLSSVLGMVNELLAAIAFWQATTGILKRPRSPRGESGVESAKSNAGRPAFALITLAPLLWLLSVTMTAGVEKIFHVDPRIGFLKQTAGLQEQLPRLQQTPRARQTTGDTAPVGAADKDIAD